LAIYRAERAAAGQAASLQWLGRALANWSDPDHGKDHALEATRCFEESLQLFTRLGDRVGAGWCRIHLIYLAFWNDDLDRAEQLATQVVQDCSPAGARHPLGQALSSLAYVAHRRGDNEAALEALHDAAALYRDLEDPWQLANVLVDLTAQEAAMGRGAEALQALAESTEISEQIGRLPGRSFRLAVAAFVHLVRGENALSISALGAYDAHPAGATEWARPGIGGAYVGWLAERVEATRAPLDLAEVAAATATSRRRSLDELLDELIIEPAKATAVRRPSTIR
jgi:sigma-54 specific flagellar transcriptional regulator A